MVRDCGIVTLTHGNEARVRGLLGGGLGEDYALLIPYAYLMRVRCNKEIINVCRNDVEGGSIVVVRYRDLLE